MTSLSRDDLMELAGMIEIEIVNDYGKNEESQKRPARRLLRKIRKIYRSMEVTNDV